MFPLFIPWGGRLSPEAALVAIGGFFGALSVVVPFVLLNYIFSRAPIAPADVTLGNLRDGQSVWVNPDRAIYLDPDGTSYIAEAYTPDATAQPGDILITKHWYAWIVHSKGHQWTSDPHAFFADSEDMRPIWFWK
jgi:hypothetical protein